MDRADRATDAAMSGERNAEEEAKHAAKKGARFWGKLSEDWIFNFSGMLAYNYLTAIAPMLLALLAIAGLVLGTLSPSAYDTFVRQLGANLPGDVGQSLINGALSALRKEAGILLAIAVIAAIYSGSRLFVALDNVFAVVFRVNARPFIQQNIMAILMMLLFLALAPLSFFATSLSATVLGFILPSGILSNGFALTIEGMIGGVLVGFIMFATIYYIVPNRKVGWATVWPGALTAAVLLNLYEALFPIYQSIFLKNAGYGSIIGLAVIVLVFLYYVGFITLLGAEINAWATGLRPLGAMLPELFQQERREGVGNAPGAPSTGVSRTAQPSSAPDRPTRDRGIARPTDARPSTP